MGMDAGTSRADLAMEDYVALSADVLEANRGRVHELTARLVALYASCGPREIRLVASGSSYNSCVAIRPFMERMLGVRVTVLAPSTYLIELNRLECYAHDAFELFVSQSGCSTNIIEALREASRREHATIGLTGNLESDMRDEADELIEWGVGNETVDFVTLGVATLMQFLALFAIEAAAVCGVIGAEERASWVEQMACVPGLHRGVQQRTRALMDAEPQAFLAPGPAFFCGAGSVYGVALEGGLKWQETLKAPAMVYEPEEFIHGPNMQLNPDYLAFFIDSAAEPGRVLDIYRATREVTNRAYLVSAYSAPAVDDTHVINTESSVDGALAPLFLIPFFQLIASHAMRVLDCEETHPLFKRFEQRVHCKTDDYDEIMKQKLAAARACSESAR